MYFRLKIIKKNGYGMVFGVGQLEKNKENGFTNYIAGYSYGIFHNG